MQVTKRDRLEKAGWKVGPAEEFLGLSAEESAYVEMKLALSRSLRERRLKNNMSQHALAARINSSQSRVAKMEAADPSVSIDLLMKSLLALGASRDDVAKIISDHSV